MQQSQWNQRKASASWVPQILEEEQKEKCATIMVFFELLQGKEGVILAEFYPRPIVRCCKWEPCAIYISGCTQQEYAKYGRQIWQFIS